MAKEAKQMIIEGKGNQFWDYCEEGEYLLRLSDGWRIENVLPEDLEEIKIFSDRVCFYMTGILVRHIFRTTE